MNAEARRTKLEAKLRELGTRLREEMLKRGFDPRQAENVALPSALAKLFVECEEVKTELEELAVRDDQEE